MDKKIKVDFFKLNSPSDAFYKSQNNLLDLSGSPMSSNLSSSFFLLFF